MADDVFMKGRLERIEKAMATYADEVGGTDYDPETVASDFLTDLMHWADANDVCWTSVTDRASKHHFDEQLEVSQYVAAERLANGEAEHDCEDDDEAESTYCGTLCESCRREHEVECEVCRKDFAERGI
jgi:hypothetical protein